MAHKEYMIYHWADILRDMDNGLPPTHIGIGDQWRVNPTISSYQDETGNTRVLLEHVGHFSSL